ncbi:MAG: NAD-dependent epimerase/dehydratase family protein [Elusimicrobia bacterium]|nr:NAD-dependent epimerase/dehydratase family protein [Elusimicrobiota bacterium]
MKALVTGAPGWMGSRLVEDLLAQGRQVRCLVHPAFDAEPLRRAGVDAIAGDVTRPESLRGLCRGVSTVFHCAGIIHPRRPRLFYEINTEGTRNLALEAVSGGVRRFIYVSSSSAGAGYSSPRAASESDPPRPFMDYGRSKLLAEAVLESLQAEGKLESVVLRPHWLYGEDGPPRQVRFFQMIRRGSPLLFGTGENRRSLCALRNCVQALLLAETAPRAAGSVYYVADERSYTAAEIYETAAAALGCRIRVRRLPIPAYDSLAYRGLDRLMQGARFAFPETHLAWDWCKNIESSIRKARDELGYRPSDGLSDAFHRAVAGYRARGIAL